MRSTISMLAMALLAFGIVLAGCTNDEDGTPSATETPAAGATSTPALTPSPTPTPEMTAQEVIDKVNTTMNNVESFHLDGEAVVQESPVAQEQLMTMTLDGMGNVGGDWQMTMDMNMNFGGIGANVTMETRSIGDQVYVKDPATNQWTIGTADSTFGTGGFFEDTDENLTLEDPEMERTTLDGIEVYKITGIDPSSPAGGPTPGSTPTVEPPGATGTPTIPDAPPTLPESGGPTIPGGTMEPPGASPTPPASGGGQLVTLWADVETFEVLKMQVEEMLPAAEFAGMVPENVKEVYMLMTVNLSDYGEPVEIEVPEGVVAPPLPGTPSPGGTPEMTGTPPPDQTPVGIETPTAPNI